MWPNKPLHRTRQKRRAVERRRWARRSVERPSLADPRRGPALTTRLLAGATPTRHRRTPEAWRKVRDGKLGIARGDDGQLLNSATPDEGGSYAHRSLGDLTQIVKPNNVFKGQRAKRVRP